ncbi:hypothetical protein FM105_12785 [Brevibacterium yomogidense]|uniref:Uncharacterized protein n=1 Tax=Brevibacterium yomogidense TaxID=946573 RepID=A0A1X6XMX5_9MICO|nr:hypothetical protein FM105_12785 [Brevibacterium yomogidense]
MVSGGPCEGRGLALAACGGLCSGGLSAGGCRGTGVGDRTRDRSGPIVPRVTGS